METLEPEKRCTLLSETLAFDDAQGNCLFVEDIARLAVVTERLYDQTPDGATPRQEAWIEAIIAWVKEQHEAELTFCQARHLVDIVNREWEGLKKKFKIGPASDSTTTLIPSSSVPSNSSGCEMNSPDCWPKTNYDGEPLPNG